MSDMTPEQLAEFNRAKNAREVARVAAHYKACFESESGRVVMADLLKHFSPDKPRFTRATEFALVPAAKIDGQADVMKHIKTNIEKANEQT